MGLFTPRSVKALREQAETIGRLHAMQHLGEITMDDLGSVVDDPSYQSRLRAAYDAAAADIGEKKALKQAVKEARMFAEIVASVRGSGFYAHVPEAAERSIRRMLGLGATR